MTITWKQLADEYKNELAPLYPDAEVHQLFLIVLEYLTSKKAIHYSILSHEQIQTSILARAQEILTELKTNKPIQHILAEAPFYGNIFEVNEHTLIPRPETEELVHLIIQENKGKSDLEVIDIGTGSGCIPISLAVHLKGHFTAVEINPETIQVAKRNDQKYKTNIHFMQADILEWELIFPHESKYDIIVSNPPYITLDEKKEMHDNVLNFEPHLALFVEDDAPLLFYDYIADFARVHLKENGTLYFEINQYLSQETADLLIKKGYQDVKIIKDINGVDRIIRAKR